MFLTVCLILILHTSCVPMIVASNENSNEDSIFYILQNRNNSEKIFKYTDNSNSIDGSKTTILMIHGWTENAAMSYCLEIAEEYLRKYDCNFIRVDWSSIASQHYIIAFNSVKIIGKAIGQLLIKLNEKNNLSFSKINIIGHSLGGHIAGFAGKTIIRITSQELNKIIALDPAGPLFGDPISDSNNRLSRTDAKIVTVIHTDGKMFGYFDPLGTIDFYPNGGTGFQPGCFTFDVMLTKNLWCSHHKSWSYFIQSINHVKYLATKCDSWNNYKMGKCDNNEEIEFSEVVSGDVSGSYYFETND